MHQKKDIANLNSGYSTSKVPPVIEGHPQLEVQLQDLLVLPSPIRNPVLNIKKLNNKQID